MTATLKPSSEEDEDRGSKRNAILTYREVRDIHVRLAEIAEQLRGIASLWDAHAKLEVRVRALELFQAAQQQKGITTGVLWTAANTLILLAFTAYNTMMK